MRDIFTLSDPSLSSHHHHHHHHHHAKKALENRPQISNFDRFFFPIVEEVVKFGLIYYLAHHNDLEVELPGKPNNVMYRWSIDQLVVLLFAYNFDKLIFTLVQYCPYNYSQKYAKFTELFTMWFDHEQQINSNKNDAAFVLADTLIKNHHSLSSATPSPTKNAQENRDSVDTAKTLVSDKSAPNKILFPPTFNVAEASESNVLSSLYKSKTMNRFQSMPILATTPDNLSASSSINSINGPAPRIKKSNFKSCYELVDKLYSVSPKNTYHLNQAAAYALTVDNQPLNSELVNEIDNEVASDDDYDNHDSTIISELDVVPYDPTPCDFSAGNSHSHHTHWGFGGGGGGGYDMPNGGRIHFGGGGGMDYSNDESSHTDEDPINNNSIFNTRNYGSCENNNQDNCHDNTPSTNNNGYESNHSSITTLVRHVSTLSNSLVPRFSYYLFISFINWFRWLCPFLPLQIPDQTPLPSSSLTSSPTKKKYPKADPFIKHKLSHYTLNKQDDAYSMNSSSSSPQNIDLENQIHSSVSHFPSASSESPTYTSSPPNQNYHRFETFVFTYFDFDLHTLNKPFEVDPIFKNFNVLTKDFLFIYLVLLNLITFLWESLTFLIFSLGFIFIAIESSQILKIFLGLIVIKLFNLNYLNGQTTQSFQFRLWCETMINSCLLALVLYYYCIFA